MCQIKSELSPHDLKIADAAVDQYLQNQSEEEDDRPQEKKTLKEWKEIEDMEREIKEETKQQTSEQQVCTCLHSCVHIDK